MKADLYNYGLIGFHDFWLKRQVGDLETNVLELIIKECFKKGIGLCAITSAYEAGQIDNPRAGLIHDRFGYLVKEARRENFPREYKISVAKNRDGDESLLVVGKEDRVLGILNSQIVLTNLDGRRVDTLVIGSNRIPVGKSLESTLDLAKKEGFMNIALPIGVSGSPCLNEEDAKRFSDKYDAFMWSSQKCIPSVVKYAPFIGKELASDYRTNNNKSVEIAKTLGKPVVAVSQAHRTQDTGVACIEFDESSYSEICIAFSNRDSKDVLDILRRTVRTRNFISRYVHQSLISFLKWTRIARKGCGIYFDANNDGKGNWLPEGKRDDSCLGYDNLYKKGFLANK